MASPANRTPTQYVSHGSRWLARRFWIAWTRRPTLIGLAVALCIWLVGEGVLILRLDAIAEPVSMPEKLKAEGLNELAAAQLISLRVNHVLQVVQAASEPPRPDRAPPTLKAGRVQSLQSDPGFGVEVTGFSFSPRKLVFEALRLVGGLPPRLTATVTQSSDTEISVQMIADNQFVGPQLMGRPVEIERLLRSGADWVAAHLLTRHKKATQVADAIEKLRGEGYVTSALAAVRLAPTTTARDVRFALVAPWALLDAGELEEALRWFELSRALAPSEPVTGSALLVKRDQLRQVGIGLARTKARLGNVDGAVEELRRLVSKGFSEDVQLALAETALDRGMPQDVSSALEQLNGCQTPDNCVRVHLLRAWAHHCLNELEKGDEAFKRAESAAPSEGWRISVLLEWADAAARSERFDLAATKLAAVFELQPFSPFALMQNAWLQWAQNGPEAARAAFVSFLATTNAHVVFEPDAIRWLRLQALEALCSLSETATASACTDLDREGSEGRILREMAGPVWPQDARERSRKLVNVLDQHRGHGAARSRGLLAQGQLLVESGHARAALADFERLSTDPFVRWDAVVSSWEQRTNLGHYQWLTTMPAHGNLLPAVLVYTKAYMLRWEHDLVGAEKAAREAVKLAPHWLEAKVRLGYILIDRGAFDEAIQRGTALSKRRDSIEGPLLVASAELERIARNARPPNARSDTRWDLGRFEAVKESDYEKLQAVSVTLTEALRIQKRNPVAWSLLATAFLALKHHAAARAALAEADSLIGPAYDLLLARAVLEGLNGSYGPAVETLTSAIHLAPSEPSTYLVLADVVERSGDAVGARSCLRRAKELDPSGRIGLRADEKRERLPTVVKLPATLPVPPICEPASVPKGVGPASPTPGGLPASPGRVGAQ